MTKPIELYQGADASIIVNTGTTDLSSATEIEVFIDTPTQIKKLLSAGQITNVTSTAFTVAIDAADTATVAEGKYKYQTRATVAGKKKQGRFSPNRISLLNSVFENQGSGNDYGG